MTSQAVELVDLGQLDKARRMYQRLARQLAEEPQPPRLELGLALLGQAETTRSLGESAAALALYREALPLLTDPARQIPRAMLRDLAEDRMRAAPDGDLSALFAFLWVTAWGPEAEAEAEAEGQMVDRVTEWLQRQARDGAPQQREAVTLGAIAALPGAEWPVLARAALLRAEGRLDEAEALLAGATPGGTSEIWFLWGGVLSVLRRFPEAIAAFTEALRRGPGLQSPWSRGPVLRAESLLFRGLAHQQVGDAKAIDDLREAAATAPNDPRTHYALGRLALQREADDEARDHFAAALSVQADFTPARLGMAVLNERAGKPAEAAAHYRAALSQDPHALPARVRFGAAMLAAGLVEEALPVLRTAAMAPPGARSSGTGTAAYGTAGSARHPRAALPPPDPSSATTAAGAAAAGAPSPNSFWGRTAAFHLGLAKLRVGDPTAALRLWEPLRAADLQPWLALARDRMARAELPSNPAAARLLWQHAVADDRAEPGYRSSLREAAIREATSVLVAYRDIPDSRAQAAASIALALSLPTADASGSRLREHRLGAAVSLAGGSIDGVHQQLDAAQGPWDRVHLAAVAVLADHPKRAVALLAPLGLAPDCDPSVARLRAYLAERAEDWPAALDWHHRFLTNSAIPADVADVPQLPDACEGCGREIRPTNSTRCVNCLAPTLRAILDCARRAELGHEAEAEQILQHWATALDGTAIAVTIRRDLALLRAEGGDHTAALAELPADAAEERAAILVRRAAAAFEADDVARGITDLRDVTRLVPDHPQAGAALTALAEREALLHTENGRHKKAWDRYRELLRQDPADPRRLHAAGLAAYRLAVVAKDPESELWSWTIACLVPSLHMPSLWTELAKTTGRPADSARVATARAALIDRLRDDLRAADRARGLTGDDVRSWVVRLGIETTAAEAYARDEDLEVTDVTDDAAIKADADATARHLVLGPTLAKLLAKEPATPALTAWIARCAQAANITWGTTTARSQTRHLFDTYGPYLYLRDQGRYAAVVAALDAIPPESRDDTWSHVLETTLTSQAREHHKNQDWRETLDCLERVAKTSADPLPADLADIAAEAGRRAALDVLNERDDDRQTVADLLEQAYAAAPDHPAVRENLGAAYAQLGRKTSNETRNHPRALTLLRKALVLAPEDPMAVQFLETVIGNRAAELTRSDDDDELVEAAGLWRELMDKSQKNDEFAYNYAYVLRRLARSDAIAGRRASAVDREIESLNADPEWTGAATPDEALRRISAMVAHHVLDNLAKRPFAERRAQLLIALSYDESASNHELRRLAVAVWREESVVAFEATHYRRAADVLAEARGFCADPAEDEKLAREAGTAWGAEAVRRANADDHAAAASAVETALHFSPRDPDLLRLRISITSMRR